MPIPSCYSPYETAILYGLASFVYGIVAILVTSEFSQTRWRVISLSLFALIWIYAAKAGAEEK